MIRRSSDCQIVSRGSGEQRESEPAVVPVGLSVVDSRQLFGRATEIGIMHDGALYRLKITRQGKLILNK